MVKKEVLGIKDIENPYEKVRKEIIKNKGNDIQYIKNPSEELQLLAVTNNPYSIRHIKNPSEKVISKALEYDINIISSLTEKYKEAIIIRKKWGTYNGELLLFQFKGIRYVKSGCFTSNNYIDFKNKLDQQKEKFPKYFTDKEDIKNILKEVKEYLSK